MTDPAARFDGAIEVDDYHTGGEPFRIITGGVPVLEGATVLARRRFARDNVDWARQLLVNEPRGHADMYGCHVTPPNDPGADLGVGLLPQRGVLDRVRARDDRARHLGARERAAGRAGERRRGRGHDRRPVRAAPVRRAMGCRGTAGPERPVPERPLVRARR